MPSFRRFSLGLCIVFGILRLCYVEDPEPVVASKPAPQAGNERTNAVAQQDNVDNKSSNHLTTSESLPILSTTLSSSSSVSSLPSSSSSSSSEVSVISTLSSSSSSSVEELTTDISSLVVISKSELDQLVLPTVAPATPQYDVETVSQSLPLKAGDTVAVSQDKSEKHNEKLLADLASNAELKSTDEEKKGNEKENEKVEQESLVGIKEALQDDGRNTIKSPIVLPGDDNKVGKEMEAEKKIEESKLVTQEEKEKNLEENKFVEKEESTVEITEKKDEKKEGKHKALDNKAVQERKQDELQEKIQKQPKDKQKDALEKEQDNEQEEKLEIDEESHKQKKKEEVIKNQETQQQEKKESSHSPPTADDRDEDSFTAKLKQAEQESNSPSEDMPSFDEFKRQLQQEEEKQKSILKKQKDEQTVPAGMQAKPKPKKIKERKQNNFASVDCGAKILSTNPEATNTFSILQDNRDIYMLNPCSAKIWFIVELCDTAQVRRIDIANFELFSSTPESFRIFVSGRYPTRDWALLGTFQARDERALQSFPLEEPIYAKYFKVEMLSHFGKEHYCPISLFRVFGTSMMEELEDHEAGGQDDSDSVDPDDDLVPVLPHDPSAKVEDKPKEPNILATVGDTLMNMVKHAAERLTGVIKDPKGNKTNDKDSVAISTIAPSSSIVSSMVFKQQQEQSKPSIVTLIPREDEDENISQLKLNKTLGERDNSTNEPQIPDKSDKVLKNDSSSYYDKIDLESEKGSKSTDSFPSCKMLIRMLGHSGFGCLMGRVLYSKRDKQKGFTPKDRILKHKKSINVKDSIKNSGDVRATNTETSSDENSKETKEEKDEKKGEEGEENKESKIKSAHDRQLKENVNFENNQESTDNISNSKGFIEASRDASNGIEVKVEIQATPSINSTSVHPSSRIEPSGSQPSIDISVNSKKEPTPSLGGTSLLQIRSSEEASETPSQANIPDSKPTPEQVKKSEDKTSTKSREPFPSQTESVKDAETQGILKGSNAAKSESSKDDTTESKEMPSSSKDDSSVGVKGSCTTMHSDEQSLVQPTTPSKCVAPSVTSNLKDVDVLEFKLLDSTGREGTAHPEKPVNQDKPVEPENPNKAKEEDKEGKTHHGRKDSESVSKSETTTLKVDESNASSDSVVKPSKAEPDTLVSTPSSDQPKEPPTIPPPFKDVIEDSVQPLPPPPIISENSTDPSRNIEVSLVDEASKASSSSINQGLPSIGAQKESIFMRLTNRIKALEQNLTLSTLYMEKLNQKYRRMVEDMQKNFDKKVNLLTNATIKAENVIKSQKEQIAQLQAKVDETKNEMELFSKKLANLNKDVMERHIIGLFLEVIFIVMLFIVFRRWDRARFKRDMLRDALKNGTVPASRDFTYYPEARKTMLMNGQPSAREQLHRSFSTPVLPENIGAVGHDVLNKHKEENCPSLDSKKRRHRKRPKSSILGNDSPSPSKSVPELANQGSVVNTAAGLLFSPARGLLNGLPDWRFTRSNSLDDSQIHRKSISSSPSIDRLQKAKSLDVIPENTERTTISSINRKGRIPTPPPPPPPKLYGVAQKRLPGQLPSNVVNRKGRGLHGNYHHT